MCHVFRPAAICSVPLSLTLLLLVLPVHRIGSEGISKAVAAGLAAQGMHLVLVSRSQAKLDAAAQDIQQHWPQSKVRLVCFMPMVQTAHDNTGSGCCVTGRTAVVVRTCSYRATTLKLHFFYAYACTTVSVLMLLPVTAGAAAATAITHYRSAPSQQT
jgi:NAD(P)-dependent dehydrogenase (short-subunit alcohol dehydrogenase family)